MGASQRAIPNAESSGNGPRTVPALISDVHARTGPDELNCLTHELRSLLDGSMRSLGLIRLALDDTDETPEPITRWIEAARQIPQRHGRSAQERDRPDRRGPRSPIGAADDSPGIRRTLCRACVPRPSLWACVWFPVIQPGAADVPAGLLAHMLANGLRNALDAVADAPERERTIQFVASIDCPRTICGFASSTRGEHFNVPDLAGASRRGRARHRSAPVQHAGGSPGRAT